jgi:hypothetical protein
MGGGKTRAFEEMRKVLLEEEGVLTIAVTYNSHWSVSSESGESYDSWGKWIHAENAEISYALSLISRMASMFYGLELTKIVEMMNNGRLTFPGNDPKELIRFFVRHMLEGIAKYRRVDTFILLVDETLRMEDSIVNRFGVENSGITGVLRRALLDQEWHFNGTALYVSLAISSLSIAPFERFPSGRTVTAILLPSKLNTTTIVTNIWNKENRFDKRVYDHMLKLIAATVNSQPRCVEIVNTYITRNRRPDLELKEFVLDIYENLIKAVGEKYIIVSPSDSVWSALIFGGRVRLGDAGIRDAIKYSIITNSLHEFAAVQELVPETSLIMLRVAASTGTNIAVDVASDMDSIIDRIAKTGGDTFIADAVVSGIDSIIYSIAKTGREGDIWETSYYEWMKIRIEAARRHKAKGEHISISKLLGIADILVVPRPYRDLFRNPFEIYGNDAGEEVQLSCKSYTDSNAMDQSISNIDKVRDEIDAVEVSASKPIVIVRPAEGESWDLCLKVFVRESNTTMHVFIENKSARETLNTIVKGLATWRSRRVVRINRDWNGLSEQNNTVTSYDLHNYGFQYRHTKKMMGLRDFVYIYFTTYSIKSFSVESAIEMGRIDSFRYLGPLYELYKVGRSVSSLKRKIIQGRASRSGKSIIECPSVLGDQIKPEAD